MDKNYWKNYYKSHKIGEKPSLFAEFVLTRLNEFALNDKSFRGDSSDSRNDEIVTTSPNLTQPFRNDLVETSHNPKSSDFITLLELGCGNGRDAIFFAKNGIKVIAIDQVADEISYLASLYAENPHFISGDFTDLDTIFKELDSCHNHERAKQSKNIPHEVPQTLASLHFSKKCDFANANNMAKSHQSERLKSTKSIESNAESHKDSADSSDFNFIDSHDFAKYRNDGIDIDSHYSMPNLTNTAEGDSTRSAQFHCIYSRFTLHSITHSQQETLLSQIPRYLAKDGILAIEARGLKNSLYQKGEAVIDEADAFIYDSHYRRFVDLERLCEVLGSLGFEIEFAKEDRGFAPFNGEDDYFFRIIATRGGQN